MTKNRSGNDFGETAKTYLNEWAKDYIYKKDPKNVQTKYTKKGILCEDDAIDFAASYFGWGMISKNDEKKENAYICGTADVVLASTIVDIKCSWDHRTFPLELKKNTNKSYFWQAQGYMDLWDRNEFVLCYVLMDAPEEIIMQESRKMAYDLGYQEVEEELYQYVKDQMTYSNFEPEQRIKTFRIYREDITPVYNHVIFAREYLFETFKIK